MGRPTHLLKALIKPLIGLLILGGLIYSVGVSELIISWQGYQIKWLSLTAVVILISTILGAYNVFLIIHKHLEINFKIFVCGYWLSWAVGLVVPGQVGDVLGLGVWLKKRGYSWKTGSTVFMVDKLISLMWMMLFASIGIMTFFPDFGIASLLMFMLLFMLVWLSLYVVINSKEITPRLKFLQIFVDVLRDTWVKTRLEVIINLCLTPLKIGLTTVAYWSTFKAAGVETLPLLMTIGLVAVSALVAYIPISFNGMGTVEWAGLTIFGFYDIDAATVLSVYISLRIIVICLAWLPSIVILGAPKNNTPRFEM